MSDRETWERIRDATGPYETLGVSRDATSEEIRTAYKLLSRTCHPDKIVLPNVKPGSVQEAMVEDFRQKANIAFQAVSEAAELLLDPRRRAELDRQERCSGRDGALVPYHGASTRPPPHQFVPQQSSYTSSYAQPQTYGSDDRPSSNTYDRRAAPNPYDMPHSKHDSGPRFDDLMGYGRGSNSRGTGDPFDLFADFGQPDRMPEPFGGQGPFDAFSGLGSQGHDLFGGAGSSDSTRGRGDPLMDAFRMMSLQGRPQQQQDTPAQRGAFASHRITRRHTSRNGDVSVTKQERTLAMMDHGDRGKVLIESSFRVMGFQPAGEKRHSSAGDGYPTNRPGDDPFGKIMSSFGAPPDIQPRERRVSMSAGNAAPSLTRRNSAMRSMGGYPDETRAIAAPPYVSKELALYGGDRSGNMRSGYDDFGRHGALVPRSASSALSLGFPY